MNSTCSGSTVFACLSSRKMTKHLSCVKFYKQLGMLVATSMRNFTQRKHIPISMHDIWLPAQRYTYEILERSKMEQYENVTRRIRARLPVLDTPSWARPRRPYISVMIDSSATSNCQLYLMPLFMLPSSTDRHPSS